MCLLTPPHLQDTSQGQLLAEFHKFESRNFLLFDFLTYQGQRAQSVQLFTHSGRENNQIHTFSKYRPGFEPELPCPFPTTDSNPP